MNHRIPLLVLVLLNGAVASTELWLQAPLRNDALLHVHQAERMGEAWAGNQFLLDHWDPTIGLGYPFPRTYAGFTHVLLWFLNNLTGWPMSLLFGVLVFLAWTLWPLSVYRGSSLLGLTAKQALAGAWCAVLLHSSFRFGIAPESYFWLGYGLLPNLLGLVLFPIALGLGVRFVMEGRGLFPFVFCLSLAFFCHLIMGYVATVSLILFLCFALPGTGQPLHALSRLVIAGTATAASCLFFLFPYFTDGMLINKTRLEAASYWDSHAASDILAAALSGNLLDYHVFLPIISLAVLGGIVLECLKWEWRRPFVGLLVIWLVLFLGRTSWNVAVWLLPMSGKLPLERFIVPVQFFAVVLAGIGLARVLEFAEKGRLQELKWTLAILFILGPHWGRNIYQNMVKATQFKREVMQSTDRVGERLGSTLKLLEANKDGGRVLVPADRNLAFEHLDYFTIPMTYQLPHVGNLWHSMSLNSDFLYSINPERTDHWQLFGLKYGLAPDGYWNNPELQALNRDPQFQLTRNPKYSGLFDYGVITRFLEGGPGEHYDTVMEWMNSDHPSKGQYLGFYGRQKPAAHGPEPEQQTMIRQGFYVKGPQVISQDGYGFELEVMTRYPGHLIGRFTWHPHWLAFVNDQPVDTLMVSPAFTGVPLQAGRHRVVLRYQPPKHQTILVFSSLATLLCCGFVSRRYPILFRAVSSRDNT